MEENRREIVRLQLEQTKKALEAHHFQTMIVKDGAEACHVLEGFIKDESKVSDGGSMTLLETGISAMLKNKSITYISHNDPTLSPEASNEEALAAFHSDVFLCSSNAITMDGALINVDGRGNRVAAMIYGPKQVIVVAGSNKLVKDEAAAISRIEQWAAPVNCRRLHRKTPCNVMGSCQHCDSEERICNIYTRIEYDRYHRFLIILTEEAYGY